jgi:hypothetical protein
MNYIFKEILTLLIGMMILKLTRKIRERLTARESSLTRKLVKPKKSTSMIELKAKRRTLKR